MQCIALHHMLAGGSYCNVAAKRRVQQKGVVTPTSSPSPSPAEVGFDTVLRPRSQRNSRSTPTSSSLSTARVRRRLNPPSQNSAVNHDNESSHDSHSTQLEQPAPATPNTAARYRSEAVCSSCCLPIGCGSATYVFTQSTLLASSTAHTVCCALCRTFQRNRDCLVLGPSPPPAGSNEGSILPSLGRCHSASSSSGNSNTTTQSHTPTSSTSTLTHNQEAQWGLCTRLPHSTAAYSCRGLQQCQAADKYLQHKLSSCSIQGIAITVSLLVPEGVYTLAEALSTATQLTDLFITIRIPPGGSSTISSLSHLSSFTDTSTHSRSSVHTPPLSPSAPLSSLAKAIASLPNLNYLKLSFYLEHDSPKGLSGFLAQVKRSDTLISCVVDITLEEINMNIDTRCMSGLSKALSRFTCLAALHLENFRGRVVKILWDGLRGLPQLSHISTTNCLLTNSTIESLIGILPGIPSIEQLQLHTPMLNVDDSQLSRLLEVMKHKGNLLEIKQYIVLLSPSAPFSVNLPSSENVTTLLEQF